MYLPSKSWKAKPTAYLQLLLFTTRRQREIVSSLVQDFNGKISKDEWFQKSFPNVRSQIQFDNSIIGQLNHSDYNYHISLTDTIKFEEPGATESMEKFFAELRKMSRFDQNNIGANPCFSLLEALKGEPLKITYKPQLALQRDSDSHKLFLTLQTSEETSNKVKLLLDYIDSLTTKGNKYGIRTRPYEKYDLKRLHTTIAQCTPEGRYSERSWRTINAMTLTKPEYRVEEHVLQELQFEVSFLTACKSVRNITRVPLPR